MYGSRKTIFLSRIINVDKKYHTVQPTNELVTIAAKER